MNKVYGAIRSVSPRLALAFAVWCEDPDEVVTLTQREDGCVTFRHPFGVGVASTHAAALEGVSQVYAVVTGQAGLTGGEDADE